MWCRAFLLEVMFSFSSGFMPTATRPFRSEHYRLVPVMSSLDESLMSTALSSKPKVAVVGGGWGGFGAAKALSENGCEVILIDAANPVEELKTPTGKPFEPGMRG